MFERARKWFKGGRKSRVAKVDLPTVPRERVAHLWNRPDGLPRVDWHMAEHWIAQQREPPGRTTEQWKRAIMAACLDELRDSLQKDHRRWRSQNVEGLAPLEGTTGQAMAAVAERAFKELRKDLRVIRPDQPIAPIAVVAIEPESSYIDFTNSYFSDEDATATSGGLYLNEAGAFPLLAVNAYARHGCEATVAHELTHHALYGTGIPQWIQEGLAQMMEERIARFTDFKLNAEMIDRQRELWSDHDVDDFLGGHSFSSPIPGVQELSYHLAQWVVRGELTRRPDAFFKFARACRSTDPNEACEDALGVSQRGLILGIIGLDEE